MSKHYQTEAELVACFVKFLRATYQFDERWTLYPETGGWDILAVRKADGAQVGIEAKLALNAKVIAQALTGQHSRYEPDGPDYRAVLVPSDKIQLHLEEICAATGVTILRHSPSKNGIYSNPLPAEYGSGYSSGWYDWGPSLRIPLPEYVPDVEGGKPAPVQLTEWKIKAIKLQIVLERRGFVTRDDMRRLKISPSRWCDAYHGFLVSAGVGRYVRHAKTPDYRKQHPHNFAEIEAQALQWLETAGISTDADSRVGSSQGELL